MKKEVFSSFFSLLRANPASFSLLSNIQNKAFDKANQILCFSKAEKSLVFFLFRLKSNNNRKKKWRMQYFHKLNAIEQQSNVIEQQSNAIEQKSNVHLISIRLHLTAIRLHLTAIQLHSIYENTAFAIFFFCCCYFLA